MFSSVIDFTRSHRRRGEREKTGFAQRPQRAQRRLRGTGPATPAVRPAPGGSQDPENKQRLKLPLFVFGILWPSCSREARVAGTVSAAASLLVFSARFAFSARDRFLCGLPSDGMSDPYSVCLRVHPWLHDV